MKWWHRWTWMGREERLATRRDPDLDLVKHMTEQHEFRLQLLENEAERIAAGRGSGEFRQRGADRRRLPHN